VASLSFHENALGEKESGGQFEIMAGRSHCERDSFGADADFEGFFDGEQILKGSGGFPLDFLDRDAEDAVVHYPRLPGSSVLRLFGYSDL
jgi:hypothetical protein